MKHYGLSHLADVARQHAGEDHYPVRRRGQKRKLCPNLDGIEWLEESTRDATEITEVYGGLDSLYWACSVQRAAGYTDARLADMYARPMFQTFQESTEPDVFPRSGGTCEACDNFAVSWSCSEHPPTAWDAEHRRWDRSGARRVVAYYSPDRPRQTFGGGSLSWATPRVEPSSVTVNGQSLQGLGGFTLELEDSDG